MGARPGPTQAARRLVQGVGQAVIGPRHVGAQRRQPRPQCQEGRLRNCAEGPRRSCPPLGAHDREEAHEHLQEADGVFGEARRASEWGWARLGPGATLKQCGQGIALKGKPPARCPFSSCRPEHIWEGGREKPPPRGIIHVGHASDFEAEVQYIVCVCSVLTLSVRRD